MPAAADACAERCPRCGAAMRCGIGGPAPCACTTVALDAQVQQALAQRWRGCLCLDCLRALAAGAAITGDGAAPGSAA